eukprot:CAMPEP_0178602640 /NCGR_PEP_ID=MMETSP0697-20121206/35074_1 /TAXON_ID=265572 /ORGANISM="Extubocellulus spinifer, Strain CCMP396" /LENGTH=72 /DNA_ID=CAMNT_0020240869 /DNA_START=742 /DNA_END=957 /DNA_ORIENTATION=-
MVRMSSLERVSGGLKALDMMDSQEFSVTQYAARSFVAHCARATDSYELDAAQHSRTLRLGSTKGGRGAEKRW